MWERRVRRWNFVGDHAHDVLARVLVGPTLVRPRIVQLAIANAYGMTAEEMDAKVLDALSFLKGGREDSVDTWVGSGFIHQSALNLGANYAVMRFVALAK